MKTVKTAFLHYSAPPVVGGVEAVIEAHARVFLDAGYPVTVIAGRGDVDALPEGTDLILLPEMDSQHPQILQINAALEQKRVPPEFDPMRDLLVQKLRPVLAAFDTVIVHNIFTKHFNLPLTAALIQLIEEGVIQRCLAWCHDFSWTSPNASVQVAPGYPWDLLRTYNPAVRYITISEQRQADLAGLLGISSEKIEVIYNGVDACVWFGLTPEGWNLIQRMDLLSSDLILLMPVRVTQAKNIELAERVLAAIKQMDCAPRLVVTGPPDPHDEGSMTYYASLVELRGSLDLGENLRFVFESGPEPEAPYMVSQQVVSDLLRVSDILFLPSHREGFGMPVLEAGLIGTPIVCSTHVPAAEEIGGKNVYLFDPKAAPEEIAKLILHGAAASRPCRFRRQVRQNFTWERIFRKKIEPEIQPG